MYIAPAWAELPQLVLTNIYEHLGKDDRLIASSSCWHWRNALFQPRFFETVTFQVCREKEAENEFYLESVVHLCTSITICFNPQTLYGVHKTVQILEKIKSNNCAQRLKFRPQHSSILLVQYRNLLELIEAFLRKRQFPLRELDLGGMECLSLHANELLEAIQCPEHVHSLSLATVKNQPTYYLVKPISPAFNRFTNMQKLSLDYDYFSDEWLYVFANLCGLRDIVLHVHGLENSHSGTSDVAWSQLTNKNPSLRLHLVLIHAYEAVHMLHSHILCPAMPLSHLKVLFCEHLNTTAIECLSNYASTLKSLVWVDVASEMMDFFEDYEQDPLVMLAWRCKLLNELVLNGYGVDPNNLIGIVRLRGPELKRLEASDVEWTSQLCEEVSNQLGRGWTPLPKNHLNSIFVNDGRFNLQLQNEYVMKCVQGAFENAGCKHQCSLKQVREGKTELYVRENSR